MVIKLFDDDGSIIESGIISLKFDVMNTKWY